MALRVVFGANVDPVSRPAHDPLHRAVEAERLGFDLVTVQDHPYQPTFYDTWTLLSYLAGRTQRITLVPAVATLPLRPPAILAKSVASLHLLTGGRVQLGLGAGEFWDAIAAMGGPRRSPGAAVEALEEAIAVIRAMWSGQRSARLDGRHYRVAGTQPGPVPGPGLGIWLGAYGPRMLALTGAKADGWMPSHGHLGLDRLADAAGRVDAAALAADRDPAGLRKIYIVAGIVGEQSRRPFTGSARQWADQLVQIVTEYGMNGIVFSPAEDHDRQLRIFAEDVVPAVRAVLA